MGAAEEAFLHAIAFLCRNAQTRVHHFHEYDVAARATAHRDRAARRRIGDRVVDEIADRFGDQPGDAVHRGGLELRAQIDVRRDGAVHVVRDAGFRQDREVHGAEIRKSGRGVFRACERQQLLRGMREAACGAERQCQPISLGVRRFLGDQQLQLRLNAGEGRPQLVSRALQELLLRATAFFDRSKQAVQGVDERAHFNGHRAVAQRLELPRGALRNLIPQRPQRVEGQCHGEPDESENRRQLEQICSEHGRQQARANALALVHCLGHGGGYGAGAGSASVVHHPDGLIAIPRVLIQRIRRRDLRVRQILITRNEGSVRAGDTKVDGIHGVRAQHRDRFRGQPQRDLAAVVRANVPGDRERGVREGLVIGIPHRIDARQVVAQRAGEQNKNGRHE